MTTRHTTTQEILREHRAAVHRNASEVAVAERHQQLAGVAEHDDATIARVSDDELVKGRARNALGTVQHADADVADELSVDAEHAHAVVASLRDCDVTVAVHEAQPIGRPQLTVIATTEGPKLTKKSAIAPVEHADAVGESL
jgi:hypothetical protein